MRIQPTTQTTTMRSHFTRPPSWWKVPYWDQERQFQIAVEEAASRLGWSYYHTYDSRRSGAGFPDLTAWSGEHLIFAELKLGKRSKISDPQADFLRGLAQTPARVYLWVPWEWDDILDIFKHPDEG